VSQGHYRLGLEHPGVRSTSPRVIIHICSLYQNAWIIQLLLICVERPQVAAASLPVIAIHLSVSISMNVSR
jgi:hypothetical protein